MVIVNAVINLFLGIIIRWFVTTTFHIYYGWFVISASEGRRGWGVWGGRVRQIEQHKKEYFHCYVGCCQIPGMQFKRLTPKPHILRYNSTLTLMHIEPRTHNLSIIQNTVNQVFKITSIAFIVVITTTGHLLWILNLQELMACQESDDLTSDLVSTLFCTAYEHCWF